ncbi:MAG TPA: hypothetical protein DIV54_03085 [Verrucomicrobiales bacterium]|nr:hypothetical protein [Verrucomicrobiales bacterium]
MRLQSYNARGLQAERSARHPESWQTEIFILMKLMAVRPWEAGLGFPWHLLHWVFLPQTRFGEGENPEAGKK